MSTKKKKKSKPNQKTKTTKASKVHEHCRKTNVLSCNKVKLNDIVNHLYLGEYVKTFNLDCYSDWNA